MQLFDPSPLSFAQPMFESSQDDSICSLGLPVILGMFDRGEMMLGDKPDDEVLEIMISELRPIIGDECSRYSEPRNYVSLVEMEDVVRRDFSLSFGFYPFREVVDDYNKELVLIGSLHERS